MFKDGYAIYRVTVHLLINRVDAARRMQRSPSRMFFTLFPGGVDVSMKCAYTSVVNCRAGIPT